MSHQKFALAWTGTGIILSSLMILFFFALISCEKDNEDAAFNADFNFEYIDDNNVQFTNASNGEYYSMIWNFGNGTSDTTTEKKKNYHIYYSEAGDYEVSLRLTNFTGTNKTISKTVSISNSFLELSFTAVVEPENPNVALLTNTTQGSIDSFKWLYLDVEVENETEHLAFFPLAGDYDVELVVTKNGTDHSMIHSVNITQDAPNVEPSFTAVVQSGNPNQVLLTNTTQESIDSFKWLYLDMEVENETEHLAYFPSAGVFDVELIVTKNGADYSRIQSVNITQDDPDLLWSEEFDYTGSPNTAKWNMETGGGGWGNNELQYYKNTQSNAKVENGLLTITAREESFGGRNYTSARITTQSKFDFKYGRIEARIKLPYGKGLWPAFWMLGKNINSVSWPACGEIDIMEMVGGTGWDNTCHSTLHWEDINGNHGSHGDSHQLSSGIFADDFHVFSLEWDSEVIRAYVDDIHYYTIAINEPQFDEFRQNFFIILNLAVGGNWPGSPDDTTVFPQTMQVDYVRVYQE